MKFELTIGQSYHILEPMPDDRATKMRKSPGSLWICKFSFRLTKVFNDGTVELQCDSNKDANPFICDARRLRGF